MFLILPVAVDYRASRQPMVTFALMGLCVLMFLLTLGIGIAGGPDAFRSWFGTLALVPLDPHLASWITSLFMHAGIFHLAGNMIYLYLFGACVEDILGRGWYVGFYLAGGIVASYVQILVMPDRFSSAIPIVGASGAISACMGLFAVLLRRTTVEFRFLYYFIFAGGSTEFRLPSWLILTLWFVMDAVGMVLSFGDRGGGVAFAAHVGGFLFGAGVGAILRARGIAAEESDIEFAPRSQPIPSVSRVYPASTAAPLPEPSLYLWIDGAQAGPFPASRIHEMRHLGVVDQESLYWDEVRNDWRPVRELPGP